MSGRTRVAFGAVAAILAVVAIILAQPDQASEQADDPSTSAAQEAPAKGGDTEPTATARSAPEPAPKEIVLRDHEVSGGVQTLRVKTGDTIRFLVSSNVPDEIHFHGYDVEKEVAPGKPARFEVKADLEGVFEVESHEAEHEGKEALIAKVVVEPS